MHRLSAIVILLAFSLVLVLAEGKRESRKFGSVSSDAASASGASSSYTHSSDLPSKTGAKLQDTSILESHADDGATHNKNTQDSISRTAEESAKNTFGSCGESDSSCSQLGSEGDLSVKEQDIKRTAASQVMLSFTSGDSNSSVTIAICDAIADAGVTELVITNSARNLLFQIPACVGTSSLLYFTAEYMTTSSFAVFPTSLIGLTCRNCHFRYDYTDSSTPIASTPAAQSIDGFNPDGTISWTELFAALPSVSTITLSASTLQASMPDVLPARITVFALQETAITGELAPGLFSDIGALPGSTDISLRLDETAISGTLPSALFEPFEGTVGGTIRLHLTRTQVVGGIPDGFLDPLEGASLVILSVQVAFMPNFNGTLPNKLFPPSMIGSYGSLDFYIWSTSLTGTLPQSMLEGFSFGSIINIRLSDNQLFGPLPYLFTAYESVPSLTMLDFRNNRINGSLGSLFAPSWAGNATVEKFALFLDYNHLTGSIPEDFLYNVENGARIQTTYQLALTFLRNGLTGSVPSTMIASSVSPSSSMPGGLVFDFSHNLLNGSFPSDFFAGLPNLASGTINLALANNSFSGSIPAFCSAIAPLWIDMALTKISGSIPDSWSACKLSLVKLSDNPNIAGSIPPNLLNTTGITNFNIKNTSINGFLPKLGAELMSIDVSLSKIQLCHPESIASISGYTEFCDVGISDACNCVSSYSVCATQFCSPLFLPPNFFPSVPTSPTPVPSPQPSVVPSPVSAPVSAPVSTPIAPVNPPIAPAPTGCLASARPGPEFTCISGRWTATTVSTPALVIPPGAGTVVVTGDVESAEVVIRSLSSSVEVAGCANNLTSLNLQLTKEEVEQIGSGTITQTLLTTSHTGCNNLNSVNLNAQVSNQGCKKLKATKQVSPDGSTLTGIFSLQTSSCNTWWIILVAVLCSVVVVAVVVIVVLVICCKSCKEKVMPFSGSHARRTRAAAQSISSK